jgi:hypothetical protein
VGADAFKVLVAALLFGLAAYGYLRAARSVGDRWRVQGRWWGLGIVSTVVAVVVVALWKPQAAGAIVIAGVAVAAVWLPSVLRRRSRPGS